MNKYILRRKLLRYRHPVLVLTAVLLIFGACNYYGLFTVPRLKVYDLFFKLKYKLSSPAQDIDDIIIVGIDDDDYYSHGKKWPWKRDVFAVLAYKLNGYKPAVIGFTLGFIGKGAGSGVSDFLLADAFGDIGNVIVASYFDKEGRYFSPHPDIRGSVLAFGFTNKPEDSDKVIRETKLFEAHTLKEEIIDYSFDLKVSAAFKDGSLENINLIPSLRDRGDSCRFIEIINETTQEKQKIPVYRNGVIPLNYSAKMDDFKVVPFRDIINDKVAADVFQDKIVLIGTTGEVFRDSSLTPLGSMPSVGIAANSVLMLLSDNFIYNVPLEVNILLLLIVGFIVSVITSKRSIYYGILLFLGVFAGFIGISIILVINNITWDFLSIPVVVFVVYVTNGLTNYVRLLIQSLRIKRFVFTDILTGLPTRRYFLFKLESSLNNLREGEPLSLVLFGIDNFQSIISEAGTEKANQILKKTGELIERCSRKTRGMDFIARYGEVEFCSILHRTPDKGALIYANRIKKILAARIESVPPLSLSIGIADVRDLEKPYTKLFVRCAETALVRGKREGYGQICTYKPAVDKIPVADYKEENKISEADLSYIAEELGEKYKEMAILANKLRTAQEDVIRSEKISAVGKMAATIHHDLGKPILNLRTGLERIKVGIDKVDAVELTTPKKFLVTALDETKRLEEMLERFKNLYRPVEKKILPVSVNSILEEMLDLSTAQLNKNSIKQARSLDPGLPQVLADDGELKQVFLNLIHNAIDAMADGGELKISSMVAKDSANMVEVQISDTGCGVSEENVDKIFGAFFTTKTKKEEKGAGLGLYASMEIIKKYGGTIKVASIVGRGTTFKVYLPCTK